MMSTKEEIVSGFMTCANEDSRPKRVKQAWTTGNMQQPCLIFIVMQIIIRKCLK